MQKPYSVFNGIFPDASFIIDFPFVQNNYESVFHRHSILGNVKLKTEKNKTNKIQTDG